MPHKRKYQDCCHHTCRKSKKLKSTIPYPLSSYLNSLNNKYYTNNDNLIKDKVYLSRF